MRRRWLIFFAAIGVSAAGSIRADEPGAQAGDVRKAFDALSREYNEAYQAFMQRLKAIGEEAERQGGPSKPIRLEDGPGPAFAPRFLALAEKAAEESVGLDALLMAVQTGHLQDGPQSPTWERAIALLRERDLTPSDIGKVVQGLAAFDEDPAAHAFLRDLIHDHPDRKVQAQTAQALADALEAGANTNGIIMSNPELRARAERLVGKERVEAILAQAERQRREREVLIKLIEDRYSDIIPNLAIGRPMPAIVGEDLDGKPTPLAGLKGKVVVIDVWATWCGPCKAMIPHERTMVEKLKGKPFELVSISADSEKETLVKFLAKEPMPWTHWWNGGEGKILEALSIRHFPTIFVLDAEGVIRFKEVRGEALEKAVDQLLAEQAARSGA